MQARPNPSSSAPVLVTGGTGVLGRLVVERLLEAGRTVRVLSRHAGEAGEDVEVHSRRPVHGEGVAAAVAGVDVVIHCAGSAKGDERRRRWLVAAATRAGVRHIVYISVVGADRIPVKGRMDRAMFGYFGAKAGGERVIAESGVPWTTLRATQFHSLALATARGMARLPVDPGAIRIPFPAGRPERGRRSTGRAGAGAPAGLVGDLAGPKVYAMSELLDSYLQAAHKHRLTLPAPMRGAAATAIKAGANLSPDRAIGHGTWEEYLAANVS